MQMNTKNLVVFFSIIASVFLLVTTVSATTEIADIYNVRVDGLYVHNTALADVSVIAGESISVRIVFEALEDASNVRVKAEIEGDKIDVDDRTSTFDVEAGKRYSKTLTLKVPYELKDELSEDVELLIKVWNGDFKTENCQEITLNVQRPTYNAEVKSITTSQSVEAGSDLPVEIVLKNMGYNDLDDVYVTAKISKLGVVQTSYFGDLVALEDNSNDDDDTDSINGKITLKIPYDAQAGIYSLEVEVSNDDTTNSVVREIIVENNLPKTVIKSGNSLLIVNPTDSVKVYNIIPESPASVSENIVVVQAGSSEAVEVTLDTTEAGEYNYNVNVLSGTEIVGTVAFSTVVEGNKVNNPVVVLTVVLAIIFLVLLIVLIVLIGKKPEKAEEFGESYY